jgi:hypothetical protein
MRRVVAIVILAAIIVGATALFFEWREDPVSRANAALQWTLLWIREENNRHLLTAMTAIAGIVGWSWGLLLWLRGRDAATQLELLLKRNFVLERKLEFVTKQLQELPRILADEWRRLFERAPREEQDDMAAKLQHAVRRRESSGDGIGSRLPPAAPFPIGPLDELTQKAEAPSKRDPTESPLIELPSVQPHLGEAPDHYAEPAPGRSAPEPDAGLVASADFIRERLENNVRQILREAERVV